MTDDDDLKQTLNRPEVPSDLMDKIHSNWREQMAQQIRYRQPVNLAIAATLAMIVTLSFFIVKHNALSPDLISAAVSDVVNDSQRHVGIALPVAQVFEAENIHPPPSTMPIQLSKRCNLIGNQTVYLKIAGAHKGFVHLFIKRGDFDAALWSEPPHQTPSMPWRLIKPRKDLAVLVLYSDDMSPSSVDVLLQTMFYA